ncbi:MAG: BON domain-containing protein [Sinobacteraceae bacterium]|nr:BON domain-containing protein [Nevskiaceae bacterium]
MIHSDKKASPRAGGAAASLLLSALAGLATVAYAGNGTDDASLKSNVEAALRADKVLLSKHIDVTVKQGEVRLGGFVEKQTDIERAKKDAEGVSGVRTVKNDMTLKQGSEESSTSGGN